MGFWSSFLGAGAAHVYNEMKKEEKETQKWNDNLQMTMNYEEEFSNYLKSIGSNAVYISEADESAASVRNKIDRYKRKIKEYLNLGGEGKYIYDVEEIDEYIEVMKYLKSVGYVNRQEEFWGLDLFLIQDQIDRELREDNSTTSLVNLQGNILSTVVVKGDDLFIPYDSWEESANTIKIATAKLYSEDTVQFLEYKSISLVFTKTNIYVYSYDLDEHSHLYCQILIDKNKKLNVTSLPIPAVEGWSMVVINDLQLLFSTSEAEKVIDLYEKHNSTLKVNAIDDNGGNIFDVQVWNIQNQCFLPERYELKFDYYSVEILNAGSRIKEVVIPKNSYINVSLADVNIDENRKIVHFFGECFVMDTENAIDFKNYYDTYDNKIAIKNNGNSEESSLRPMFTNNINQLSGVEFEKICQQLVENMGFETETTKASGDGGIDLIAYNYQPLLSGKYIIQCKRYSGSVGEPIIRDLYGVVTSERANKGILMTTGYFTKSAIAFADEKPIELIDGVSLQNLFSQYGISCGFSNGKICLSDEPLEIKSYDISAEERIACIEALNQFCDYTALKNVLSTDSNNCSLRSRIIDMITYTYFSDNRLSCDLPMQQYKYKRCLAQMLREEIKWFYEYADDSDIKIQTIRDFYFLYLAQIELTQGDFYNAFKLYNKALNSKTYRDCRIECENANSNNDVVSTIYDDTLAMIVMNMCQILAVLGLGDCANRLKSKYKYLIGFYTDIATTTYTQHPGNYWATIEYEWYSNSCTPYAFRFIVFEEEYFNNLENNLYDGSLYNNFIVDSTLTTYSELRKISIDQEDLFIDNTVCLDYQDVLRKNRNKIKQLFM